LFGKKSFDETLFLMKRGSLTKRGSLKKRGSLTKRCLMIRRLTNRRSTVVKVFGSYIKISIQFTFCPVEDKNVHGFCISSFEDKDVRGFRISSVDEKDVHGFYNLSD
jgi:hypothetical protein